MRWGSAFRPRCERRTSTLVVFYEKPLVHFERLLETYIAYAPRGFRQFLMSIPLWLKQKLHLPRELDRALGGKYKGRYVFTEHHESHAASAFFPSPFEEDAILTLDGVGEWATASAGVGRGNRIELQKVIHFPHSLGLLYSAFTYYTGFRVNSGEYKLMGLAPYGEPKFHDLILKELLDLKGDGSFRLNMRYFPYGYKTVMVDRRFERLFGVPVRKPEGPITEHTMDVAASIQSVTEEIMLRMARNVHQRRVKNPCWPAEALNCVGNGRSCERVVREHLVQPAAGDAGGALGAASGLVSAADHRRKVGVRDAQGGSLPGPAFDDRRSANPPDVVTRRTTASLREADLGRPVADLIASESRYGSTVGIWPRPAAGASSETPAARRCSR